MIVIFFPNENKCRIESKVMASITSSSFILINDKDENDYNDDDDIDAVK